MTMPQTSLGRRAARLTAGLGLALTMAFGAALPTLAADPGLTITGTPVSVAAGTLSYKVDGGASGAANTIALDGKAHNIAFTVPITATDFSGDDLGWNTTVSLGQFKDGSTLLGEAALAVTPAASAACDTSDAKVCSNSNAAVANGVTPATYTTGSAALKVFSSDAGAHVAGIGMGQYTYATSYLMDIPSTAKKGTYASTMTVTITSAP